MSKTSIWQSIRMRDAEAGSDPDATPRALSLPATWDDAAAAALAALAPGQGRVRLPDAAQSWIRPLAARARMGQGRAPADEALDDRLHMLLMRRQAAPTPALWQGLRELTSPLGFVLNLPGFHDSAVFDVGGFTAAIDTVALALRLADPAAERFAIGFADLDGLLAILGLDYDSEAARDVAACLAGLLRARADVALAGDQPDLLCGMPAWPAPPMHCAVPGLAEAAAAARCHALRAAGSRAGTAILVAGPAEALLGTETGGIAPAFSPVREDGTLTRAAIARLAAAGLSPEAALAALLRGDTLLAPQHPAAHLAMHDRVAAYLHAMPPRPVLATPAPAESTRRALPARTRGYTQKVAISGHRAFLRTGEFEDGTLGEVEIAMPREGQAVRALLDAVASSVSIGLQHGVGLATYVEAYALTRFGPAGEVEGDPSVAAATSVLDWAMRHLAHAYLGGCAIADPALPTVSGQDDTEPLLPMDLPNHRRAQRLGLRLVAAS